MEEEKKGKGFVVKDRRLFGESGEARPDDTKTDVPPGDAQEEPPKATGASERTEEGPSPSEEDGFLPEVNFANFILSLGTTAFYHFGDLPDEAEGKAEKNLAAAKQTIDLLSMLESKTKGNLDKDEQALLEGILYELRLRFVKETTSK
ncbi:MAG: DUF1844 domain-containing protein [Syntrophales bacterium]|jgi:hypothetical protein|nr:DUF1844 domain-containing protein [Syntrophales bacterium]